MSLLLPISLSLNGLRSLTEVSLSDCGITALPESLGGLSLLQELYLDKNNFARITESIKHLSKLEKLDLSYCARLHTLPELPCNLFYLEANPCTSLKAIPGSSSTSYNSLLVDLRNSFKLDPDEPCEILLKVEKEVFGKSRNRQINLAGNEIPNCFSFQWMGSSMNLPAAATQVVSISRS
ncbi:disease resistance-like protein DSC1 [Citrus sinensis]|uniref:disease resistance-like protein DSC1 n=1 Tax=Citrus sinensis TaxID=2711 RepID=UPI0022781380|nr:disease resistance-like protein DSC1 [Citrus sinensis]